MVGLRLFGAARMVRLHRRRALHPVERRPLGRARVEDESALSCRDLVGAAQRARVVAAPLEATAAPLLEGDLPIAAPRPGQRDGGPGRS